MTTTEAQTPTTETPAHLPATQSVRQSWDAPANATPPRPDWIRGTCPTCGAPLVSNCYYVGGRGYQVFWECWKSLDAAPSCTYRKVL